MLFGHFGIVLWKQPELISLSFASGRQSQFSKTDNTRLEPGNILANPNDTTIRTLVYGVVSSEFEGVFKLLRKNEFVRALELARNEVFMPSCACLYLVGIIVCISRLSNLLILKSSLPITIIDLATSILNDPHNRLKLRCFHDCTFILLLFFNIERVYKQGSWKSIYHMTQRKWTIPKNNANLKRSMYY